MSFDCGCVAGGLDEPFHPVHPGARQRDRDYLGCPIGRETSSSRIPHVRWFAPTALGCLAATKWHLATSFPLGWIRCLVSAIARERRATACLEDPPKGVGLEEAGAAAIQSEWARH